MKKIGMKKAARWIPLVVGGAIVIWLLQRNKESSDDVSEVEVTLTPAPKGIGALAPSGATMSEGDRFILVATVYNKSRRGTIYIPVDFNVLFSVNFGTTTIISTQKVFTFVAQQAASFALFEGPALYNTNAIPAGSVYPVSTPGFYGKMTARVVVTVPGVTTWAGVAGEATMQVASLPITYEATVTF